MELDNDALSTPLKTDIPEINLNPESSDIT